MAVSTYIPSLVSNTPRASINPPTISSKPSKPPVVVILGATGAGKSRLAIDLAHHFPAEIINADSMQVYKGLDILTNKVSIEERRGIPHHLLGIIDPTKDFTAKHFRDLAFLVIDGILKQEKLPIIVGGTNYYVQALVTAYLMDDVLKIDDSDMEGNAMLSRSPDFPEDESNSEGVEISPHGKSRQSSLIVDEESIGALSVDKGFDVCKLTIGQKSGSSSEMNITNGGECLPGDSYDLRFLTHDSDISSRSIDEEGQCTTSDSLNQYKQLEKIDPQTACRVHPNDSRRVYRYLKIYYDTGRKPSELFEGYRLKKWGSADTLRYNCCFFWVDAETPVLDKYVEERVDVMMQAGLLNEVADFYVPGAEYTRGLRQAIGAVEFSAFFDALSCWTKEQRIELIKDIVKGLSLGYVNKVAEEEIDQNISLYKDMVTFAVKKIKINTRRLVRLQKRRLGKLGKQYGWKLHRLDVSDVLKMDGSESADLWERSVLRPSVDILKQFLSHISEGQNLEVEHQLESENLDSLDYKKKNRKRFICEACGDRVFIGWHQWRQHISGNKHKKKVSRIKKMAELATLKETLEEGQGGE